MTFRNKAYDRDEKRHINEYVARETSKIHREGQKVIFLDTSLCQTIDALHRRGIDYDDMIVIEKTEGEAEKIKDLRRVEVIHGKAEEIVPSLSTHDVSMIFLDLTMCNTKDFKELAIKSAKILHDNSLDYGLLYMTCSFRRCMGGEAEYENDVLAGLIKSSTIEFTKFVMEVSYKSVCFLAFAIGYSSYADETIYYPRLTGKVHVGKTHMTYIAGLHRGKRKIKIGSLPLDMPFDFRFVNSHDDL